MIHPTTVSDETFETEYTAQSEAFSTDLAVIQSEISALITGNTAATLEQIGNRLGGLYQQAEQIGDTVSQQAITETWERAQVLAQNTDLLLGAAVSATHTLRNVEKAHERLVTDMQYINHDNPLVQNLIELVEEDITEDWNEKIEDVRQETRDEEEDKAYNTARDIVFDEIVIELENICRVSNFAARQFAQVIIGGYCPDRLEGVFLTIGEAIENEITLALDRGDSA